MKITIALLLTAGLALWNGVELAVSGDVWRVLLAIVLGVLAYVLGRRFSVARDGWALLVAAVAGVGFAFADPWDWFTGSVAFVLGIVLPWFAGRFRRQQVELIAAGRERVEALEREQALIAADARRRERERIAADMHDSLGHELALIALRAGLLELTPGLGEEQSRAVGELRAAAGSATERLRQTIGLLREDAEPSVIPADESVEDLVERARAAGLDVTLDRDAGVPPSGTLADRALHRVVQESLTNAAKHAPGARVRVRVTHTADGTHVLVRSPLVPEARQGAGGGQGLIGLAERVRLAGGTFEAGPAGGDFRVTAVLPMEESS
ncbi:histidine kinase [Phytomonospora sp. NPDC050363]|uniref:sensor histidine kinase n=1 Tax=Phytomonospora sp. NPDC050363 TaxID=3155642 RepID=UPI0034094D64